MADIDKAVELARRCLIPDGPIIYEIDAVALARAVLAMAMDIEHLRNELRLYAPTVDCGSCGLALRIGPMVAEDDEVTCGCGAVNQISIENDEAYFSHWRCKHGKDDESECAACDAEDEADAVRCTLDAEARRG